MNNLKLSKIQALAETMVQIVHNLELTEDDMEVYLRLSCWISKSSRN